jgi:hypothetical protein
MTTIVHRRYLPPREAAGPGARLGALTWVGWASLVGAIGMLASSWWFLLDLGEPRQIDLAGLLPQLAGDTLVPARIALPAALEWGVPGARKRVPWLWRGSVLIALAAMLGQGIDWAQSGVMEDFFVATSSSLDGLDGDRRWMALSVLGLGVALIRLAGWWAIADGLADAGARISRPVLIVAAAFGTLPVLASVAVSSFDVDTGLSLTVLQLGAIGIGTVTSAVQMVAAARLVAGGVGNLPPASAWVAGALAGALLLIGQVTNLVGWFGTLGQSGNGVEVLGPVLAATSYGPTFLLLLAFALGLGRGRWRQAPFVPGYRRGAAS